MADKISFNLFTQFQLLKHIDDVRTAFYHSCECERALSEYGGGEKISGKRIRYKKTDYDGIDPANLPGINWEQVL